MKRIIFLISFFLTTILVYGQIVISDDSTYAPGVDDAILEAHSSNQNKGFLPPRIPLQSATSAAPVNNPRNGLLIYNTANAASGQDTVYPGYYYWNGSRWTRLIDNPYQGVIFGHIARDTTRIDTIPANGTSIPRWTGSYIDLPPGIWVISVNMLLQSENDIQTGDVIWVRSTFCDSQNNYTPSSDIMLSTLVSGLLPGPAHFSMAVGSITINNTSNATKRYYYWISTSEQYGTKTQDYLLKDFGCGGWGENQFFAIPVR